MTGPKKAASVAVPAPGQSVRAGRLLRLLITASAFLALLACGPEGQPPATTPASVAVSDPLASGPGRLVRLGDRGVPEALVPLGMLRQRPELDPTGNWLHLHHARGESADFLLRLALSPQRHGLPLPSGPGWFNYGPADDRVLEAAAAPRSAHYRMTSGQGAPPVLRLEWTGDKLSSNLLAARGRRAINGSFEGVDGTRLHLALRFSHAFREAIPLADGGLELHFPSRPEPLELAVALSTVDLDGARANLGGGDMPPFAQVQREARTSWDELLGRLQVSGSPPRRSELYSAMYRVLGLYGDLSDTDGRYRSASGELRRVVPGQAYIGNLALDREWRTVVPLLSLLMPERMPDLFNTLLAHQRATGLLPERTAWGRGQASPRRSSALPVLAALVNRDLPGVDSDKALAGALREGLAPPADLPWDSYQRRGYFAFDEVREGSISRTIDASMAHHATASIAAKVGEKDLARAYAVRALFYRQLFDFGQGQFRGRSGQRDWRTPFAPLAGGGGASDFDGGDPWAALWAPGQFDLDGLLALLDGRQGLADRLDAFYAAQDGTTAGAATSGNRQAYWHVPWLYLLSNQPAGGRALISDELERLLTARSLAEGNAATSARALFTALGIYPLVPAQGSYFLGVPLVASVSLDIGGQRLLLEAPGLSDDATLEAGSFNGSRLPGLDISHRRLAEGGELRFMLAEPAAQAP